MRRSTSARVSEPTSDRPLTTLETVTTETPAISASCERVRASEDAGPAWGASSVEVIAEFYGCFRTSRGVVCAAGANRSHRREARRPKLFAICLKLFSDLPGPSLTSVRTLAEIYG